MVERFEEHSLFIITTECTLYQWFGGTFSNLYQTACYHVTENRYVKFSPALRQ